MLFERLASVKEHQPEGPVAACPGCAVSFGPGSSSRKRLCLVCGRVYCSKCIAKHKAAFRVIRFKSLKTEACVACVATGTAAYRAYALENGGLSPRSADGGLSPSGLSPRGGRPSDGGLVSSATVADYDAAVAQEAHVQVAADQQHAQSAAGATPLATPPPPAIVSSSSSHASGTPAHAAATGGSGAAGKDTVPRPPADASTLPAHADRGNDALTTHDAATRAPAAVAAASESNEPVLASEDGNGPKDGLATSATAEPSTLPAAAPPNAATAHPPPPNHAAVIARAPLQTISDLVEFCPDCGRMAASCRCGRMQPALQPPPPVEVQERTPEATAAQEAVPSQQVMSEEVPLAMEESSSDTRHGSLAAAAPAAEPQPATTAPDAAAPAPPPPPPPAVPTASPSAAAAASASAPPSPYASIVQALAGALQPTEAVLHATQSKKTRHFRTHARMLVLTTQPRLLYCDPTTMAVKGSLDLKSAGFAVELVSSTLFHAVCHGKKYPFKVDEGQARGWVDRIMDLM